MNMKTFEIDLKITETVLKYVTQQPIYFKQKLTINIKTLDIIYITW